MLDSPLLLLALGMSAASGLALLLGRRKCRPPSVPAPRALSAMSTEELAAALAELRPDLSQREVRETVKVLLIRYELERREPLKARE